MLTPNPAFANPNVKVNFIPTAQKKPDGPNPNIKPEEDKDIRTER